MANEKKNLNFEMSGQSVRKNDYEQRNNANLENVKSARKEGRKKTKKADRVIKLSQCDESANTSHEINQIRVQK